MCEHFLAAKNPTQLILGNGIAMIDQPENLLFEQLTMD